MEPGLEELCGLVPDPDADPPDGAEAGLAGLAEPLLQAHLAAAARPSLPQVLAVGFLPRDGAGGGPGFGSGGAADVMVAGSLLAQLAEEAGPGWAAAARASSGAA